jgi:hypothetical protein
MKIYSLIVTLLFFICNHTSAQYFSSGQDPAKIKWSQIKTDNFQLIFPCTFEQEAQRLAKVLEVVYDYDTRTLGHEPKRISVVLHNYSSIGNAFVAWAPKRSEFYTIPQQDLSPQNWLDQLAIHEYRHVVQIDKMNQGLTKILYFILGEQATAGVLGLFVPLWFLEGDAVVAETGLSNGGRGRLPSFNMEMRAQILNGQIFSYEKAVFGSYKDFVPNHYKLGYLLVANGRKRYGAHMWDYTLTNVARHPYTPTPFSNGIKRLSGLNKWKYYHSTMNEFDSLWTDQKKSYTYTPFTKINKKEKKIYTNYRFPQYLNDSTLVAQKFGLGDIDQFVKLNGESEEHIYTPGYFFPIWLSAKGNLLSWSEYGYDKRWQNRIYHDILTYNFETKKRKRLTRKKFLFAPAISNDAKKIVTVEVTPQNIYSIVILDALTGKEVKQISHPENAFLLTPTWADHDSSIAVVMLTQQGKALALLNLQTELFETIVPFSFTEISKPVSQGNYIFFHGIYSGLDNIYAVHKNTKQVFQITSSLQGAFDPALSPNGRKLAYAEYTAMGYDIAEIEIDSSSWKPLHDVKDNSLKLYEVLAEQEGGALQLDSLSTTNYAVKKYSKFTHLVNIHSWAPLYVDADNVNSIDPKITVLSQNKLSTLFATLGYQFNYNEQAGSFQTEISYEAWYPVISFTSINGRRATYTLVNEEKKFYNWKENSFGLGISQPLNLTKGKYTAHIIPSIGLNFRDIDDPENAPANFIQAEILDSEYEFQAFRILKRTERDMRSRWGQSLSFYYKSALKSNLRVRDMLTSQVYLYFPGIGKHHSTRLTGLFQRQGEGAYNFMSPVSYLRGYQTSFVHRQFYKAAIDYKLPLLYPDLRIGPLIYIRRINANLFYEYGLGLNAASEIDYHSTGIELTSDVNLLNFIAPFQIGARYIYLPKIAASKVEVIFNVSFNSI